MRTITARIALVGNHVYCDGELPTTALSVAFMRMACTAVQLNNDSLYFWVAQLSNGGKLHVAGHERKFVRLHTHTNEKGTVFLVTVVTHTAKVVDVAFSRHSVYIL